MMVECRLMLDKPLDDLDAAHILALVPSQATEGRNLEFKRDAPGRSEADVKEFLADATSFANAQGGDLIFGVEETNGVATGVPGIEILDLDSEILRLENLLRDAIDPRLSGVRIKWIEITAGRGVLILRIPASLTSPHRVTFKGTSRFYARNSRGKYEMDTHELRQAFTSNEELPRRIRGLHATAIAAATGQDMPYRIILGPRAIVSIIPLGYFREIRDIDLTRETAVLPVNSRPARPWVAGMAWMEMLEGILLHSPINSDNTVDSYTLTHRSGRIDAAWTIGAGRVPGRGVGAPP
jgi:hypothetical protein